MAIQDLLTSTVIAALVAGFVAFRSSERKLQIENVTQERAKWREKIRANALLVHLAAVSHQPAKLDELHLIFQLLLNPFDEEDKLILQTIKDLRNVGNPKPRLPEFESPRVPWRLVGLSQATMSACSASCL